MATSTSTPSADYFNSRHAIRARPPPGPLSGAAGVTTSPNSPQTPLLGRSISGQFGSPGSFRSEQEDFIIYELGARHLSAGFTGEGRPRCIHLFRPEDGRRVGDYRACDPSYRRKRRKFRSEEEWEVEYELYRTDLRSVDLGLVEDKLVRSVRKVHADHLQLDQKPRKAVLAVPSLLPTPLLEVALKVLFNHYAQPPSVMLLTTPLLACVGAGLRNALVIELGWEETVVTGIGEYKEVLQRRSVRAGKRVTREMAKLLQEEVKNQRQAESADQQDSEVSFGYAEEVTQRMGWCRSRAGSSGVKDESTSMVRIPSPDPKSHNNIHIPFTRLSKHIEEALFTSSDTATGGDDDHDLPIQTLAYRVLLALSLDLRAICASRIIITGGLCQLPGIKARVLQELAHIIDTRGWDPINSYGSATSHHERILKERSTNIASQRQQKQQGNGEVPLSPAKKPIQEAVPHSERIHDDKYDTITQKAELEANKGKVDVVKGVVRGVETLGAWAGASLMASLRVKGVHEVERDDFMKNGLRDSVAII